MDTTQFQAWLIVPVAQLVNSAPIKNQLDLTVPMVSTVLLASSIVHHVHQDICAHIKTANPSDARLGTTLMPTRRFALNVQLAALVPSQMRCQDSAPMVRPPMLVLPTAMDALLARLARMEL